MSCNLEWKRCKPLPSELGTNTPAKATSWPWLEPFSVPKSLNPFKLFPHPSTAGRSLPSNNPVFRQPSFPAGRLGPYYLPHEISFGALYGARLVTQPSNFRVMVVTEAGSYLRLTDFCITQLTAQGPSRFCYESEEEESLEATKLS